MTIRILGIFSLVATFCGCQGRFSDLGKMEGASQAYPKESISLITVNSPDGQPVGTGWVDTGYLNYALRGEYATNIRIVVDLTDSVAARNPDLDMASVEDYFIERLRSVGVAHFVSRVTTDNGLEIETYVGGGGQAEALLSEMGSNPERLVSFRIEVQHDPNWNAVKELLNM